MQTRKNDLMQLGVMLIAAALAVFAALWLGKVLYGLANVALSWWLSDSSVDANLC